jgi:hypothetical protein
MVLPRTHPKPIKTHPYLPKLTNNPGEGVRKRGKTRGGATHPRKKQRRKEKSTQNIPISIERKAQKGQKVQKAEEERVVTSSWPWRPFESTCELREQPMRRKKRKRNVSKTIL